MKMNIKITKLETGFLRTPTEIIDIDICNGNWKYNDDHMETEEKISLTINNICKSVYLSAPVKDAYPFHDHEKIIEDNELIVTDSMVRIYDSLIDYLNHRINNVKDDYKKHGWTERDFTIVLFDLSIAKFREDAVTDIVYEKECLCEVKITVVE